MTERIERRDSPLSDPVESIELPDITQSYSTESDERHRPPHSETIGNNKYRGLPDSEALIEIAYLDNVLAHASIEDSHRQTEADELAIHLKAETGYSSYADYLKAYSVDRPYIWEALRHLEIDNYSPFKDQFTILDLSKEKTSGLRVVPRCYSTSATRIVTALRQPPANVAVQIALWYSGNYACPNVLSALGLGLKIDPRFFEALGRGRRRHLDPKHVTVDGAVATVIRHYKPDKLDAAPIVFIARLHWEMGLATYVEEEIGGVLPFQYRAVEGSPFYTSLGIQIVGEEGDYRQMNGDGCIRKLSGEGLDPQNDEHPNYTRLLKWCLEKDEEPAVGATNLILQPLIPLLYLGIFRIRNFCESIRQKYHELHNGTMTSYDVENEGFISKLPANRFRLRAMVEDSRDDLDHFLRYIRSQKPADFLLTNSWLKAEEDLKRTHQEAARLEAQIRDYLQLQVGELALQESKKSIELSNRQIEEGKRVKIFTILAFVYVPLNLATSIFGMNLSELNGSGKELWVFLTTAMLALLFTGASWFLVEEINNYLRWQRRNRGARMKTTIGARISMLAWLCSHGHKTWMWKSGAWWRILVKSTSRLTKINGAIGPSVCEYVSRYSDPFNSQRFTAFDPDDVYEWIKVVQG